MAAIRETQECFPREQRIGLIVIPKGEPNHERCSGGHTMPGILGGWVCPCPCHNWQRQEEAWREPGDPYIGGDPSLSARY